MPILDIQRRSQEIGRIRLGIKVPTKSGKMRPEKLTAFRFTTRSRLAADAIAETIGGEVRAWTDAPTGDQWEVITQATSIPVIVPPGDAALSQWYELWSGGGCQRRCDGRTEHRSQRPCMCPEDPAERQKLAAAGAACKPTTRVNVIIPDLPGLGVWRVESHGYNAAVELGGAAELLALARENGVMVPAVLRLEQRKTVRDGKTNLFAVPVLDIVPTFRQLTELTASAGIRAALPPAPVGARAITASSGAAAIEAVPVAARPVREEPGPWAGIDSAKDCAAAIEAESDLVRLTNLGKFAATQGWMDHFVSVNPEDQSAPMEALVEVFRARAAAIDSARELVTA